MAFTPIFVDRLLRGAGVVWRVPDEASDGAGELDGLVLGDERVAVSDLDKPPLWEDLGEPASMLWGHHPVLGGPRDERRALEGTQPFGRLERVALVHGAQVQIGRASCRERV